MCTSIISNRKKTIVGWNLDILDMEYRVREAEDGVYIEINDTTEGWMPLFGANNRGDFVGMPTCWPFDERSNPSGNEPNVIMLDIDLLTQKKTFEEVKRKLEDKQKYSKNFDFEQQEKKKKYTGHIPPNGDGMQRFRCYIHVFVVR